MAHDCTLYSLQTVQCTLYTANCTLTHSVHCTLGVAKKSRIFLRAELQVLYISGNTAAKFQRKIMTATPGKCRFMFALKQFYE